MRGPEHYREAERLLAGLTIPADPELGDPKEHYPPTADEIARAQAHLLAAQVALAVEATGLDKPGPLGTPDWAVALNGGDSDEDLSGEATCRVCGCTESRACEGGCHWVDDPQMGDLCSRCGPDAAPGWLAEVLAQFDAGEITPFDAVSEIRKRMDGEGR